VKLTQDESSAGDIVALRERLVLEREETVRDEIGGSSSRWIAVTALWANMHLGTAAYERLSAARPTGRAIWRISVRRRRHIHPGMRFRKSYSGGSSERSFHILATEDNDSRRRFLTCVCEERT
jgi:head-tail adaptor